MDIPLSPYVPENLVSRDGFSRPVPRQPAHLHTQAESGAYLRDSSRVPRRCPFMKPPYAIGSVPSLSGQAIAYRGRSLPRVRRYRASKPQGSSERVLPCLAGHHGPINNMRLSFPHPLYWYEVGMLKVPAVPTNESFSTCWAWFFVFVLVFVWKIPVRVTAPRFELMSQHQRLSRLPTEPPGRPAAYYVYYKCKPRRLILHVRANEVEHKYFELSVSTPTIGRLQPRTREDDARRRN